MHKVLPVGSWCGLVCGVVWVCCAQDAAVCSIMAHVAMVVVSVGG
jgi:hypothetical protein